MSTVYDPVRLTKLVIFGTEDLSAVDIQLMGAQPVAYPVNMQPDKVH